MEDALFFAFNLPQTKIQQLITIICEQYPNYNQYALGCTLCEFICDQLEQAEAVNLLGRLYLTATAQGQSGIEIWLDSMVYRSENEQQTLSTIQQVFPEYKGPMSGSLGPNTPININ